MPEPRDDTKKEPKTFSLTVGLVRDFEELVEQLGLQKRSQSALAEFLLQQAIQQVKEGTLKLPLKKKNITVLELSPDDEDN